MTAEQSKCHTTRGASVSTNRLDTVHPRGRRVSDSFYVMFGGTTRKIAEDPHARIDPRRAAMDRVSSSGETWKAVDEFIDSLPRRTTDRFLRQVQACNVC
jgi:hypothetical protein